MGRGRYRIHDDNAPFFLTCTVLKWLPLFAQPANARILLESLDFLREQGRLQLYGYVILENHCHLLAAAPDLGKTIASFKSFTAKQIIKLAVKGIPGARDCDCASALKTAIVTNPEMMAEAQKQKLDLLIGKYLRKA